MTLISPALKLLKACSLAAVLSWSALAAAAVEVNRANQAELEQVSGLGPQLASRILAERERHGAYQDWVELIARVRGVSDRNAYRFSLAGLTVNGKPDPFIPPPLDIRSARRAGLAGPVASAAASAP